MERPTAILVGHYLLINFYKFTILEAAENIYAPTHSLNVNQSTIFEVALTYSRQNNEIITN